MDFGEISRLPHDNELGHPVHLDNQMNFEMDMSQAFCGEGIIGICNREKTSVYSHKSSGPGKQQVWEGLLLFSDAGGTSLVRFCFMQFRCAKEAEKSSYNPQAGEL